MTALSIIRLAIGLGVTGGYVLSHVLPHESQASTLARAAGETPQQRAQIEHSAYYANCAQARADGRAPIFAGQPGYRDALDADGDGIACEPYSGKD